MSIANASASRVAEISDLRPYLMRVARSRLDDPHAAEDAVQEALAAACSGGEAFSGRSTLRTWVTGILLHKIADAFRAWARAGRTPAFEPAGEDADADFDEEGRWRAPVSAWSDPQLALECRRFRAELEAQLARLPEMQSRAFVMREVQGLDSGSICAALGITEGNLFVLLHRARLGLRRGLDREWFSRGA